MNLKNLVLFFTLCFAFNSQAQYDTPVYESETLKIQQITKNTYLHTSYLQTEKWGKVGCNGMFVVHKKQALIVDTPVSDSDSKELIDWIETNLKSQVIGVIVTHFHIDCLGGLKEFHNRQISSYANDKTIELAKENQTVVPQNGFDKRLELIVGKRILTNEYVGEGHTRDNIVSYFPTDKVLFGGCLIKEMEAGKGNLADANVDAWAATVEQVKMKFGEAEAIIPGHGKPGGYELLDYTIGVFNPEKASVNIKIEWTDEVDGDFSFIEKWDYPEGVYKNRFGQISCDGFCPREADFMKLKSGMIIKDSLDAFYELVDTTHYFHSMKSQAWTYAWGGTNYMNFVEQEDGTLLGQSAWNIATHSILNLKISNDTLTGWIYFNSIRDLGEHKFPISEGTIKIDRVLFSQGIVKAEFSFKFKNTLAPERELFWKGLVFSKVEEGI